ncbi:hypothetical protein HNV27_03625 [Myxococcus xanthus]|uniref:transposase n=1 Tax=Myxococcus xanthus TaxID=34 RepID=UPI00139030CF|nr:hypothetical protein [Myxococcus xanthus]
MHGAERLNPDGLRCGRGWAPEPVGRDAGRSELMDSWLELLRQLLERGLNGVRFVIAYGHAGLVAASRARHVHQAVRQGERGAYQWAF